MIWKQKKTEDDFETRKELAIAAITVVYNNVPESKKVRDALKWAIDVLEKQEE